MFAHPVLATAILLSSFAAIGCAGAPADDASEGELGVAEQDVYSTNRLSLNRLSLNRLSLNGLSAGRLSQDGLTLTTTTLGLDDAGRDLLRYVVRCALPADQQLTTTVDGVTHTFSGGIGLAPKWLTESLKIKEQRWVSACLLAHVNGYGIEVPISLRGHHPSLATDPAERADYAVQEISFYGNVFVVTSDDGVADAADADAVVAPSAKMYGCAGKNVQLSCGGSPTAFGPLRSCGGSASCALPFTGACRALSVGGSNACEKADGDSYAKCISYAKTSGAWPHGSYEEVVTVYLKQVDFNALYPGCGAPQ